MDFEKEWLQCLEVILGMVGLDNKINLLTENVELCLFMKTTYFYKAERIKMYNDNLYFFLFIV